MDELKLYGKTEKGLDLIMQTVRIFTYDMCMEFGIEKCTIFFLMRGIKDVNTKKMKQKVKAQYLRRTRKVLESKVNGVILFKAINSWTVSVFCYSAVFMDWTTKIS